MRGLAYNPGILPAEMIIRQRVKPMPSREELLKRNSFGSVNDNKYLNAMWRKRRQPVSVTVEKIDVLSFVITGAERLDPVRVMIENYEPGKGRITSPATEKRGLRLGLLWAVMMCRRSLSGSATSI